MGITTRARRIVLAGAALVAAVGVTTAAPTPAGAALPACTVSWAAPVDGDWGDATRWSTGSAPGPEDHVCITVTGGHTVTFDAEAEEVGSLRVGSTTGSTGQTLVLAGGALHVTGGVGVATRGALRLSGGGLDVGGDLRNEGTIGLGFGEVVVDGHLTLTPTSTVHTDLVGGEAPDAGRITTAGIVTVDGDLVARTADATKVPEVGSLTPIISGAQLTGTLDDVRFEGHATYVAGYSDTSVELVRIPSESPTKRFVRAAYQDFLGHQPDPKELSLHATLIDGGHATRASLVRSLSRSTSYVTTLVQRFYADTLGRPGDPDGVAFWVDQLRTGRRTIAQVAGSFYASPEYFGRWNNTSDWVDDLYEVFFGRGPSGDEQTYWTERAHTLGRTRVATEMFQSLESRRQRVHLVYRDLLGRAGDPDGVDYWAGRITREGDLALAVSLAASGEYLARAEQRYP